MMNAAGLILLPTCIRLLSQLCLLVTIAKYKINHICNKSKGNEYPTNTEYK